MNTLITSFSYAAVLLGLLLAHPGQGQTVGIGTATPDASAALEIAAADRGLLVPRVGLAGLADAGTIPNPAPALLVYNTNAALPEGAGFYYNAGTAAAPTWVRLQTVAGAADNLGNHTAAQNLNMQGFAVVGDGADIGANVGLGVRADGGLNIGQTTGRNLLLGYRAGDSLALGPGTDNHLTGYRAGQRLRSSGNHFDGLETGFNTTTGIHNLFVGSQAGYRNTGGSQGSSQNHFIGFQAGFNARQTGFPNHFEGFLAGFNTTTGGANTFVGYAAGYANTTGEQNVALGVNAAGQNPLGNCFGTTLLGAQADLDAPGLQNATALGYRARVSQSNSLVLGGTGAYAVKVGVGLTAPATELDVKGAIMARNRFVLAPQNGADPASNAIWATDNFNANYRIFNQPNLTASGTTYFTIKNSTGQVGIGAGADPRSTLEVKGTLALTPVLGLAGGPAEATAAPLNATPASFIGLNPQAGALCYALPPASSCPGRNYLIRNNSVVQMAYIYSQGGLFINGSESAPTATGSYLLLTGNNALFYRTVWLVSDGVNWLYSWFGNQY